MHSHHSGTVPVTEVLVRRIRNRRDSRRRKNTLGRTVRYRRRYGARTGVRVR